MSHPSFSAFHPILIVITILVVIVISIVIVIPILIVIPIVILRPSCITPFPIAVYYRISGSHLSSGGKTP